jgi:hypothetical protein
MSDSFVQSNEQHGWQNHENKKANREGKDEMDRGDVHKIRFVWLLRVMLGGAKVLVTLGPKPAEGVTAQPGKRP